MRPVDSLVTLARRLALRLYPPTCLLCGAGGESDLDLCAACRADLPWLMGACGRCALPLPVAPSAALTCGRCQRRPPPFDAAVAALHYTTPVPALMRRYKRGDLQAGDLLSRLLAARLMGLAERRPLPQALVPVPLHPGRRRARGFDQAERIAGVLARQLGLARLEGRLVRLRATAPQRGMDAAERRRNLRHAFGAEGRLPAHIALIDDVHTTGATFTAAALAARAAGAARIEVWSVARA